MRSSTAVGLAAALGRLTSMPRYIIGAVSMKINRRTSTTSTSGMMLISESDVLVRPPPSAGSGLNILGGRTRHARGGATQDVEELEHEAIHLGAPVSHPVHEEVVAHDRGHRGAQTGRRGDEGLGDARSDDGQAGRALLADAVKGGDDAPHGSEQPDEGRHTGRGGEEGQVALETRDLLACRPA